MTRRTILAAIAWAAVAGGVLAILTGNRQAVSLRIWLGVSAVWFCWIAVHRLYQGVPLVASRLRPIITRRPAEETSDGATLRELRLLDGLLARSRDNARAFDQQLRPRLMALADHYLPLRHSIDPRTMPERANELLHPVGWLIDPNQTRRTPTTDELEHFVKIVTDA